MVRRLMDFVALLGGRAEVRQVLPSSSGGSAVYLGFRAALYGLVSFDSNVFGLGYIDGAEPCEADRDGHGTVKGL
jgi:hypothetical protein